MDFSGGGRGGGRGGGAPKGASRVARVKNKQAAPIQITAEQILREAAERQDAAHREPKQEITDPEEMEEFRVRARKSFEDNIRKNRQNIANWFRYAKFEEEQRDITRTRSVFERALDVDFRNPRIWLQYAEMEMRNKNVNHARNIWERAVTLHPRQNTFWFRYVFMEQMLENYAGVRQIFERWIKWEPEEEAWNSFVKFELRHGEVDRAREIYKKYVIVHPKPKIWSRWAKFEERMNNLGGSREVYEQAIDFLESGVTEKMYIEFAKFEERQKEFDRARAIYKFALDNIPRHSAQEVYSKYISFEKQFGGRSQIEEAIRNKRRLQYEADLKENGFNYDVWFDYIRLEESIPNNFGNIREVYERAIANSPPVNEKKFWRRYIYLWINYAIFEELEAKDPNRARQVYKMCLDIIPHKKFSFSKIWIMYAEFEIRQKNLTAARKIFGVAVGKCPKEKIYQSYIDLEKKLGNFDRSRTLYQKFLEYCPSNCAAWVEFAKLEMSLDEVERVRHIFELAVEQPLLDMPEIVWKNYIDFEIGEEDVARVRELYGRLLQRTKHCKIWVSFASFEKEIGELDRARKVYEEGIKEMKMAANGEERAVLLKSLFEMEQEIGNDQKIKEVKAMLPDQVKRRRPIYTEDGMEAGMEEYWEYVFPEDKSAQPNLKLLERAKKWKKKKAMEKSSSSSDDKMDLS